MADFGGPSDMAGGEEKGMKVEAEVSSLSAWMENRHLHIWEQMWGVCMGAGRRGSTCMCSVQD